MKRKRTWLIAGIVAAAAIALGACSTATTTTPPPQQTTSSSSATTSPPTTTTPPVATTTAAANKPQYGGTLNLNYPSTVMGFDEAYTIPFWVISDHLTNESMLTGNWALGPAGSGQYNWTNNGVYRWDAETGCLATSWQIVKPGQYVFHIRQGVHFGLNPNSPASELVNGREMTADDVVYSLDRLITAKTSYIYQGEPGFCAAANITAPDKWTVDINVNSTDPNNIYPVLSYMVDFARVIPKEVVDKYGSLQQWEDSVGTGPFFLTDYVSNSVMTFQKNPNYWGTNPLGPGKGQQLPYVDEVHLYQIVDTSTQLAAARTAKLDSIGPLIYDNAQTMISTAPKMQYYKYIAAGDTAMFMRTDQAPFNNIKVREALMEGTDLETLGTQLVGPNPVLQTFPITPGDGLQDAYMPLSQMPADVQALYKYNPQQAKTLLAQAGYPDGFKTTVTTSTTPSFNVDYLSAIKAEWQQIGVDLSINEVEQGVYLNLWGGRKNSALFLANVPSSGTYTRQLAINGTGGGWNLSYVNDPKIAASIPQMEALANDAKDTQSAQVYQALEPYIAAQAWAIPTPVSDQYTFWWPWMENYRGEYSVGILDEYQWSEYVWINSTMKTQMGF